MSVLEPVYQTTVAHPEIIFNCVQFICDAVKDPDIEKHTNKLLRYDLSYGFPDAKYLTIIDRVLENKGIHWRMHSAHADMPTETGKLIIRKASLIDLANAPVVLEPYYYEIYDVMRLFAHQYYNDQPYEAESHLNIFKNDGKPGYYWIYTRTFDMWDLSDHIEKPTWKPLVDVK